MTTYDFTIGIITHFLPRGGFTRTQMSDAEMWDFENLIEIGVC